ncbi:MAG TPA: hypothetical protein VF173_02430 [Thermoanaerobaculia bacterium]|nr:hypothetical protein [Thermoanaerobaculia bacterium]
MSDNRGDTLVGLTCFGAAASGTIGVIIAIMAAVAGNFTAAGITIIGSGPTFVLLAYVILRK